VRKGGLPSRALFYQTGSRLICQIFEKKSNCSKTYNTAATCLKFCDEQRTLAPAACPKNLDQFENFHNFGLSLSLNCFPFPFLIWWHDQVTDSLSHQWRVDLSVNDIKTKVWIRVWMIWDWHRIKIECALILFDKIGPWNKFLFLINLFSSGARERSFFPSPF